MCITQYTYYVYYIVIVYSVYYTLSLFFFWIYYFCDMAQVQKKLRETKNQKTVVSLYVSFLLIL